MLRMFSSLLHDTCLPLSIRTRQTHAHVVPAMSASSCTKEEAHEQLRVVTNPSVVQIVSEKDSDSHLSDRCTYNARVMQEQLCS
jgi:hypothetical protein